MRLTFKLTAGTLIAVALLLAINVWFRVQREADTFQNEMKRDHLMLSRALRVDIIDEWHDGGQPAAFQLIQKINAEHAGVDITAWHVDQVPDDIAFTLNEGREVQRIENHDGNEQLVTWSPIAPRGRLLASLRIDESLDSVRAYVISTLERTATSALVGLLVVSIVAWLVGFFAVGRPVQALVDKARRVGRGELDGDVHLARSDELSVLAEELNEMSKRLKSTRAALAAEAEARVKTVEQLRHADRLSTVGTLAAGIAHELGTPLNVVLGRAQMIAAGATDPQRQAKIVEEQTRRVIRIVRQLLDFARAERPAKDEVDLRALVASTVEMLSTIALDKDVNVKVAGDDGVFAHVDDSQIQQALTNLVMNAIQATPPNSTVTVTTSSSMSPPASSPTLPPGRYVTIEVRDEGKGIDEAVRARLFSPFFTTKPPGEGTGLGLAVAWGIVRENGGAIEVEATPPSERGARFRIVLPEHTT